MATTSQPRTPSALVFSLLAVIALGGIVVIGVVTAGSAANSRPLVGMPLSMPGSVFEKTAEHGYIATGEMIELTDDDLPSLAKLDPTLLDAVREAAESAESEGVHLSVTSGWRSAAYQQWLLDQAVDKYGSLEEAAKWVSTPDTSRHVSGDAIDIGPFDATLWMQSNGPRFGLCQIYANELWHYELASAHGGSCPALRDSAAG